jgi:MerR family mercuric resistance operon transcriptional regulator
MQSVPWYGVKEFAMNDELTIGRLAKAAGVNVETIRYYQRRGLVDEPTKPLGGHRRYPPSAASRVRFIKRAQQLGFTLDEVTGLLRLEDGQSCRETRLLAERKLTLIEMRLADLTRMRRTLKGLIAECAGGQRPRSCPIIATLSASSEAADRAK